MMIYFCSFKEESGNYNVMLGFELEWTLAKL